MILPLVRSHYSLLYGTSPVPALCRRARQLGYTSLALTDRDNLHGLWPFLHSCREEGIRAIVGAEVTEPASGRRVFCLVRDDTGYTSLCRLLTARHCDPRFRLLAAVRRHWRGLCILTDSASLLTALHRQGLAPAAALPVGPTAANSGLRRLARRLGLRAVAVTDAFFPDREAYRLHCLVRAIATRTTLSRLRAADLVPADRILEPAASWHHRFAVWPEVLDNAGQVLEQCTFAGPATDLVLPPYGDRDRLQADRLLRRRSLRGARQRYGNRLEHRVRSRLDHELKIIAEMGFSSYFLVVNEIVRHVSRTCGRGSGAASLVAYCLGITNVCPLEHNLYFERFLNPGRRDAPDMDIDFAWDEREQVIRTVLDRYGCQAAMVCNLVGFRPRMAVREVARVYGLPEDEIGRVSRRLPWFRGRRNSRPHLEGDLPELRGLDLSPPWPEILALAARLTGLPRHVSIHAGGVVITPRPVSSYVPVQQAARGIPLIQWDKDSAEDGGLVKIDLLGNRSLGVIRDCLHQVRCGGRLIRETAWQPEKDPATRQTVARGRTMGCFYIESPAMRLLQQKSGRGDFAHLVIHSSIIRPAANEFIREYLRRLHGAPWEPIHPLLTGLLDETFGIMVYQEDISRVAVRFGFSHAEADQLRKVISKKHRHRQLADFRELFFSRAAARGVGRPDAEKIWAMMMSFDGYSFCKPHSASYARVSFQAAWLKTHFPAEFMAAVLSNRGGYYSTFAYVSEARRLGLRILHPDVNRSDMAWTGHGDRIRVGLMAIRGLGGQTREQILRERPFSSMADFLHRVCPGEEEARNLVHSGALDSLQPGADRTVLLWELRRWLESGRRQRPTLFPVSSRLPKLPPEDRLQRLRNEFRSLGFLCSRHPITLFSRQRLRLGAIPAVRLPALAGCGRTVSFAGWLITGKIVSTRTGQPMEFLTFEDETGLVECTFFPRTYHRYCHLLHRRGPLLLRGRMEREFGAATMTVQEVRPLTRDRAQAAHRLPGR